MSGKNGLKMERPQFQVSSSRHSTITYKLVNSTTQLPPCGMWGSTFGEFRWIAAMNGHEFVDKDHLEWRSQPDCEMRFLPTEDVDKTAQWHHQEQSICFESLNRYIRRVI